MGFSCSDAIKSYFTGTTRFTRVPSNYGKRSNFVCALPKIQRVGFFCMIFIYLVNLAWGVSPEPDCNPNLDNFFSPMSTHKEFNSTWITLVAFFDPKHFLVENGAPESIYFLTPNTQYPPTTPWYQIVRANARSS